jgi:FkbM family methyltransferase
MYWMKRLASRLPRRVQQDLKRLRFRRQIRAGKFLTSEPEFARLGEWIGEGDWVIDVGANIGHYTLRMAELVGRAGRVLAFEPVPETFELLTANISAAGARNVSLFNVAASATAAVASFAMPRFESGLLNYYMAGLTSTTKVACDPDTEFDVLTIALDDLVLPKRVALVKIDVEGHELNVLEGMEALLRREHPLLVVEDPTPAVCEFLRACSYDSLQLPGSPNRIFRASAATAAGTAR